MIIQYIDSTNAHYTESSNGVYPTDAYTQYVEENGTIYPAFINGAMQLAESNPARTLNTVLSHPYAIPQYNALTDEYEWVQETAQISGNTVNIEAADMPNHLVGWQTSGGTSVTANTLTPALISTLFPGSVDTCDLYGVWERVNLVRVIVYFPYVSPSIEIDSQYSVNLYADDSYNPSYASVYYEMSDNYKDIQDTGRVAYKRPNIAEDVPEYGVGDGSPVLTQSGYSYYGVKNGDGIQVRVVRDNGMYIPEWDPETLEYFCYFVNALTRQMGYMGKVGTRVQLQISTLANGKYAWTSPGGYPISQNGNDVTIAVPITRKPFIKVLVTPSGSGHAYIGSNTAETLRYFMPGDTCTLTCSSANTFLGWYDQFGNPVNDDLTHSNMKIETLIWQGDTTSASSDGQHNGCQLLLPKQHRHLRDVTYYIPC